MNTQDEHSEVKLTFEEAEARKLQEFDAKFADFEREAVSDDDRLFTLDIDTAYGWPNSAESKALAELFESHRGWEADVRFKELTKQELVDFIKRLRNAGVGPTCVTSITWHAE